MTRRWRSAPNNTIGLFILEGQPSAALEFNDKGKGRILSKFKGKCNVAGKIAEIEFQQTPSLALSYVFLKNFNISL